MSLSNRLTHLEARLQAADRNVPPSGHRIYFHVYGQRPPDPDLLSLEWCWNGHTRDLMHTFNRAALDAWLTKHHYKLNAEEQKIVENLNWGKPGINLRHRNEPPQVP